MKWIVGGLLLAVVASVASGRVPLVWVVYCFAVLFISMGGALFFAFSRNRHYGLLVLGIVYVAAAIAAIAIGDWWPLVAGFAIAWVLRMAGLEPKAEELPDAQVQSQSPAADTEKKI